VSGVRVVDRAHHLLTLQEDRELNIELYVNKGRGYVESDQHPVDRGLPVDLVRVDAIYNPVRRANFAVAETRVGQRTDYDRLTLTVETNGTLTPEEAVSYARRSRRRTSSTSRASARTRPAPTAPGRPDGGDARRTAELLRQPIDDLELSVRSVNSLKNSNVRTLGDLVRLTEGQILQVKNFGKKSLQEIADLLEREGLNFGMRYEEAGDGVRITDWGPRRAEPPRTR
jgi:DNA-directed RNA polymerase subunit alpha